MRSTIRLLTLLLVGVLTLSGCAAMRSLLGGDSPAADTAAPEAVAEPSVPRFTFFESWASW